MDVGLRQGRAGGRVVTAMLWLGSATTLGLFVYLVIALVRAEEF